MAVTIQGGPAVPVSVISSPAQSVGGPAIPVAVVTDGRAVQGGPAQRIIVVTNPDHIQGGPALPIVAAAAGARVAAGPALRVYVVQGSFGDPALAYTNMVIALGPLGYWPLAESSGSTAFDASGHAYDGAYINATLGVTGIGDGRTAASFAATGRVGLPATFQAAVNRSEGTVAFWVQISGAVWADGAVRAMVRISTDGANRVYLLKNGVANQLALRYDAGGVGKIVTLTPLTLTSWMHIALTWSKGADQVIGYMNGVPQGATLTGLGVWAGAVVDAEIAASDTAPNNPFSGQLAHVAVWGSALPAAQILSLARGFSTVYTQKVQALAPIAYWPLAEASGTTIVDESGNARNGAYKGAGEPLLGQTGIGDGRTAALFDGVNDYGNLFSASLQAVFNGAEGTIAVWATVSAAGVWTDATDRRMLNLRVDANNRLNVNKTATNSQISCTYVANGTSKGASFITTGPLTFFHIAMTWSKSADQVKLYVNGVQQGATATGLGVWAGSLAAGNCAVGAADLVGSNEWSGTLAHAAVWASALSAAQILQAATL